MYVNQKIRNMLRTNQLMSYSLSRLVPCTVEPCGHSVIEAIVLDHSVAAEVIRKNNDQLRYFITTLAW